MKQLNLARAIMKKNPHLLDQNQEKGRYELRVLTHVGKMKEGTAFGEIALEAKDESKAVRQATIQCDTDIQLAVFTKTQYKDIIQSLMVEQLMRDHKFISSFKLFEGIQVSQFKGMQH